MTPLLSLLVLFGATCSVLARKECTVPAGNGKTDDSPAILKVFQDCSTNSQITFSDGVQYNVWSPLDLAGLNDVVIELNGSLHLPDSISAVQNIVKAKKTIGGSWIRIKGTNVRLIGKDDPDWAYGSIWGYGEQWWKAGQKKYRPHLASFNVVNGEIANIKVIKPIAWTFSVSGQNVKITNHFVDAAPDNVSRSQATYFPSNTDCFNFSGQNIVLDGHNCRGGDDCVSILDGASNIVARNGYCGFSTHGLSIGSLGEYGEEARVENVLFENWTMEDADFAARFKSWTGGKGKAENITWRNIEAKNVKTAILATQTYWDSNDGGRPGSNSQSSTYIQNFNFENIHGTLGPFKSNGKGVTDSIILTLFKGSAADITFKDINIQPNKPEYGSTTVQCNPDVFTKADLADLGIQCVTGQYKATK